MSMLEQHNNTDRLYVSCNVSIAICCEKRWSCKTCNYDLLLVINTNVAPILHRFRDIAFEKTKIAINN